MRRFVSLAFVVTCACTGTSPAPPAVAPPAPPPPAVPLAAPPPPPAPVSTAIHSSWDARKQASHALERLAYGPRPGEADAIAAAGVEAWIRRQMKPATIADGVADGKLRELPTLAMSPAELHVHYPRPKNAAKAAANATPTPTADATANPLQGTLADHRPAEIDRELAVQKLVRAIESERQLQEVLVDFWFNHFNVFADKGADKWLVGAYERDAIRSHVFGKFRGLLGSVAHDPAMLFYLDNWLSVADGAPGNGKNKGPGGINENYGRELLELHTLGVDGGYTQDDVRDAARAFTGWSIEKPNDEARFVFRKKKHDDGAKTILGQAFAAGGGERDGEAVLDLVANHPATARFIARKLCTKFIADDPPQALVDRVADVFTKSGGDLSATYEAIFFSDEFWADAADGSKTKTPLEVAASAVRAVGAQLTVETDLPRWVARMGEPLYRAQPPTGYKETADAWVSTGALVARIDFGLALAAGRVRGVALDSERLVGTTPPEDPAQLVDRLAPIVIPRPLTATTRDTIVAQLRSGNHGITYQEGSQTQLPQALGLLLGSPEFQKQ
jgi:uncharacterized protein (DUF1800 family)